MGQTLVPWCSQHFVVGLFSKWGFIEAWIALAAKWPVPLLFISQEASGCIVDALQSGGMSW